MLLSFLVDIPIFLPLLGAFLFWMATKGEKGFKIGWSLVAIISAITIGFCFYFQQRLLLILLIAALLLSIVISKVTKRFLWTFSIFTLAIFWIISGGLYFDLWGPGGNHFMWYSWLDKMGIVSSFPIPTPTYEDLFGVWNLLGFALFLSYPIIMLVFGRLCFKFLLWIKGVFFGNIKGQTGLWGLFTNK